MLINIENFNFVHFSGGEVHLNAKDFYHGMDMKIGMKGTDIIWAPIHDSVDLMELLILTDAYKRYYGKTPEVCIPYIPYARQDRVANEGESLSIKVFADIINAQGYPKVWVFDPHSEVCMALINNVKVIDDINDHYLNEYIDNYKDVVVVAPDAGAYKRLCKVIKFVPLIYATKQRDTKTGALSNVELHLGDTDITGKSLLIVDDICDGGGTFLLLADALRNQRITNPLELYVSHGIFSKGIDIISEKYSKIYTTNSFYQGNNTSVKVINLIELLRIKKEII